MIINYGKDRCGNMNKNLALKNSKLNKKMKKNSKGKKLNYLEEKRKNQESNKKPFIQFPGPNDINSSMAAGVNNQSDNDKNVNLQKFMPLDSLGITIETNDHINETVEMQQTSLSSDFYNTESKALDVEDNDDVENSDISSDLGIMVNRNHPLNDNGDNLEPETNNGDGVGFDMSNRFSDNNISSFSSISSREHTENSNDTQKNNDLDKNSKNGNVIKHGRIIPGSDVMAQYLAQLQHSTFIYAANVLGASSERPDLYKEDE